MLVRYYHIPAIFSTDRDYVQVDSKFRLPFKAKTVHSCTLQGGSPGGADHLLYNLHLYLAHAPCVRRAMNSRIVMTRAVQGVGACTVSAKLCRDATWIMETNVTNQSTWIHTYIHIDHHRSILIMSSKRVL